MALARVNRGLNVTRGCTDAGKLEATAYFVVAEAITNV